MKIIVDAFGGDNAPVEIIKGCAMAVQKFDDVEIILAGDEERINEVIESEGLARERMEIVHAPDVIEMSDHPTELMKSKKNSSMAVGLRLLAEGPQFLSVLPRYTIHKSIHEKKLAIVPVQDCEMRQWRQLLYHKNKVVTPQIQGMLDTIVEYARKPI